MQNMKEKTDTLLRGLLFCLLLTSVLTGFSQQSEDKTDSLFAARLMLDNLELYDRVDSLSTLVKSFKMYNAIEKKQIDSLQTLVAQYQSQMALADTKADTGFSASPASWNGNPHQGGYPPRNRF